MTMYREPTRSLFSERENIVYLNLKWCNTLKAFEVKLKQVAVDFPLKSTFTFIKMNMILQWRRAQVFIYPLMLSAHTHTPVCWLPHKVITVLLCLSLTQTDEGELWSQDFSFSLCGNKYIQFCFSTRSPTTISLFSPSIKLSPGFFSFHLLSGKSERSNFLK